MRRIPLPPACVATAPELAVARCEPIHAAELATTIAATTPTASAKRLVCPRFMSPPVSRVLCPGRFDDIDTIEVVPARASDRRARTIRAEHNQTT